MRGLLVTGRGIPRSHCAVLDASGAQVGEVTSGTFSPTLKQGIALDSIYEAYWVTGKMKVARKNTQLGAAAYSLAAQKVEIYKY